MVIYCQSYQTFGKNYGGKRSAAQKQFGSIEEDKAVAGHYLP